MKMTTFDMTNFTRQTVFQRGLKRHRLSRFQTSIYQKKWTGKIHNLWGFLAYSTNQTNAQNGNNFGSTTKSQIWTLNFWTKNSKQHLIMVRSGEFQKVEKGSWHRDGKIESWSSLSTVQLMFRPITFYAVLHIITLHYITFYAVFLDLDTLRMEISFFCTNCK